MNEQIKYAISYLKRVNQEWAKAITYREIRGFSYERLTNDFKIIENALNQAEENEKALKIIAQKWVDTVNLRYFKTVEDYNVSFDKDQQLTQTEFDLVKKVVEKYGNQIEH